VPRFALLVSIRDFAASKLAASPAQEAAVERRHAEHYLAASRAWRKQIDTHQGLAARQRIEAEMDDLLAVYRRALDAGQLAAALEVALAIDAALMPRGPHERRIALLDAALRAPAADREVALSAEAIFARAHAKRLLGRAADAREDCEMAVALAEAVGDRRLQGRALGAIGLTLWEGGDGASAAGYIDRALQLHTETADRDWLAATLNNRGLLELADGRLAAARGSFEQALRAHRAVGNRRREAMNLNNLAYVDCERGLLAAAHATLAEALEVARKCGDARTEATVTLSIGLVHLDAGEIDVAQARTREALALAERSCDRLAEAQARAQLGQCLHATGDLGDARVEYGRALALCRDAAARGFEGLVHACLASLEASAGRPREARAALEAASEALAGRRDAGFEQARTIARAHVQLCGARGGTDAKAAVAARITASALLQTMAEPAASSPERRLSIHARFIAARIAESLALPPASANESQSSPDVSALLVESDGRWFQVPGGKRVGLHRRRAIGRVLRALVDARLRAPGSTCPPDVLLAYGWPGERCDPRSGAARVYNALATLRKLGLRTALLSRDDGYLLDPEQTVRVVSDALR
jgi:tetratricopeptide (TPR) repeat protein